MMEVFIAGFLGGLIKGLVGVTKHLVKTPDKKRNLRMGYFILMLFSSGGLGLIAGVFIANDPKFALLAGYAGTDFIDSLFKIRMRDHPW